MADSARTQLTPVRQSHAVMVELVLKTRTPTSASAPSDMKVSTAIMRKMSVQATHAKMVCLISF